MRSILVAKGGALGDWVLTLPACSSLRQACAPSRMGLLGRGTWGELALRAGFDLFYRLESPGWESLWIGKEEPPKEIQEALEPWELVVSFLSDPEGTWAARALQYTKGRFLQIPAPTGKEPVGYEHWKHLCQALRLPVPFPSGPWLSPLPEDWERLQAWLEGLPARSASHLRTLPWVILHPGSGSRKKNWPLAYWAPLLERLRRWDASPILLAGEAERAWIGELAHLADAVALELSLGTVLALLSRAALYIGNDSGITHLAAACGCPVLALFGPSDSRVWRPFGPRVALLEGGPKWEGLPPERVLAWVEGFLCGKVFPEWTTSLIGPCLAGEGLAEPGKEA